MSKKRDSSAKRTIAGGFAGGVAGLAAAAALRKRRNVLLDTAASRSWLRRKLPNMPPAAAKKLKLRSDRLHSDADLLNEAAAQLPTAGVAGGAALGALSSSAREKKAEIIKEGRKMRMPKAFSKKMRKKLGFPKVGEEKAVMKSNQLAMSKTAGWFTAAKKTTKETASQAGARILKSNPELTKKPVANLSNARLQLQELKRQRAMAAAVSAKAYNPKVVTASMRSSHRIDQALVEIQRKFESLRKEEHTLPWRTDHGRYVEKTASTSDACALTAMMHTGTLVKEAKKGQDSAGKGGALGAVLAGPIGAGIGGAVGAKKGKKGRSAVGGFGGSFIGAHLGMAAGAPLGRAGMIGLATLGSGIGGHEGARWAHGKKKKSKKKEASGREKVAMWPFKKKGPSDRHRALAEKYDMDPGFVKSLDTKKWPDALEYNVAAFSNHQKGTGGPGVAWDAKKWGGAAPQLGQVKKASVTWYEERLNTPSSVLGIEKGASDERKRRWQRK